MHFTCLFLFRKSFGTEKHCWTSHAFRIFLVAGHQALDGWQMPGLVERLGLAVVCVGYQLAGKGSGGSKNVLLGAYGQIPLWEKKE